MSQFIPVQITTFDQRRTGLTEQDRQLTMRQFIK